jgi:hypothetical protein
MEQQYASKFITETQVWTACVPSRSTHVFEVYRTADGQFWSATRDDKGDVRVFPMRATARCAAHDYAHDVVCPALNAEDCAHLELLGPGEEPREVLELALKAMLCQRGNHVELSGDDFCEVPPDSRLLVVAGDPMVLDIEFSNRTQVAMTTGVVALLRRLGGSVELSPAEIEANQDAAGYATEERDTDAARRLTVRPGRHAPDRAGQREDCNVIAALCALARRFGEKIDITAEEFAAARKHSWKILWPEDGETFGARFSLTDTPPPDYFTSPFDPAEDQSSYLPGKK